MLILSLIASAMVLTIAGVIAAKGRHPLPGIFTVCGVGFFGQFCVGFGLPAVLLQCFGMFLASIVWRTTSSRPFAFLASSSVITVLSYVTVLMLIVVPEQKRFQTLRNDFPFEDMTTRVASPRSIRRPAILTEKAINRLNHSEELLDSNNSRNWMLERLHERSTEEFVNSAGFGVSRMMRPSEYWLRVNDEYLVALPQPGQRDTSAGAETFAGEVVTNTTEIEKTYLNSLTSFLNPRLYGYVKDRKKVAGFVSHRFTSLPVNQFDNLQLQTLDLVGLLMHEEPVAYVSEHLPKMDELRVAPTRPLDAFEGMGLQEIQKGEDLYARESGNTVRLLGAIRATKQCTTCHACERGDLLGAFSYTLKRGDEK